MDSTASEVRVYRLSGAVLQEVARLSPVAPPRAVEGPLRAPEVDADHGDGEGAGLFLALVQGGRIADVARLVFHGGEPSDADAGQDCYSSGTSTGGSPASSGSTEVEVLPQVSSKHTDDALGSLPLCGGLVMGCEDGQLVNPSRWDGEEVQEEEDWHGDDEGQFSDQSRGLSAVGQSSSRWWSGNQDSSSEDEDPDQDQDQEDQLRGEDWTRSTSLQHISSSLCWSERYDATSNDEQDDEEEQEKEHGNESEKEEKDGCQPIMIKLRLWPAQKHALIKIFIGGKWVLTKDYILSWLKFEDMIEYNLNVDFGAPYATVLGFRNNDCIMDFEVNVDCTPMLDDLVTLVKPSVCNFQILKKVGGEDACKVFKCLFMGSKCALKSLTQKDPFTLEPREIEIISSLKDTHVNVFYQAWIEPWAYKGKPKQDYLFIHLEFCPSTLNHALLYKNKHWFPNKWILFEEIVRIVQKLHETYVVHRDLKPNNIFFNSELVVRVGDFGDACIGCDELGMYGGGTAELGTQHYLAPELNSGGKVTEKVDIYSMGMVLFEMFAIFETGSEKNHIFTDLREQGPPDSWHGDRQLYDMMTAFDPSDRPSAAQVLDYIHLHHLE